MLREHDRPRPDILRVWRIALPLVAGALVLASCSGEQTIGEDSNSPASAPATTVAEANTTTSLATTSSTTTTTTTIPEPAVMGTEDPPGVFVSHPLFRSPYQITIPSGWGASPTDTSAMLFVPGDVSRFDAEQMVWIADLGSMTEGLESASVEETVEHFRSEAVLTITDPQPTTVGNVEGVLFDVTASETISVWGAGGNLNFRPEWRYTVRVVDVDGRTVTIWVIAPTEAFPDFQNRAQEVVDSIVWKDHS